MNNTFLTIIVDVAIVEQMRQLAASWAGGEGMFTTGLTSNGTDITHYISTGYIYGSVAEHLPYSTYTTSIDEEGNVTTTVEYFEGNLQAIVDMINDINPESTLTVSDVESILSYVDSSTQNPKDAMKRKEILIWQNMSV